MTNIFDTHAHYSSRQFDADRDAVMRALGEGGVVGVLECATHSGDAAAVLELAGQKVQAVPIVADEPLDEAWVEPMAFDGCSTKGQGKPGDPQPIHFVRKANAQQGASV